MKKKYYIFIVVALLFPILSFGSSASTATDGKAAADALKQNLIDMINAVLNKAVIQYNEVINSNSTASTAALYSGSGTGTSSSSETSFSCKNLSTNLRMGDSGEKVSLLTGVLVDDGELSAVSDVFNQNVFDAVIKYQEKYAKEILTPEGLDKGTGFVGPNTRSHMNKKIICMTSGSTSPSAIPYGTPVPASWRYLKINTTTSGWVSIGEIEIYDQDGNKVRPVDATASCDWCGYGTPPAYSIGPKGVYDGDILKTWNAGETADNCSWYGIHMRNDGIMGVGCASWTIRKAWVQVDLGKNIMVSKIRFVPMGNAENRVDDISVSQDGTTYYPLVKFQASAENPVDRKWLEYNITTSQTNGSGASFPTGSVGVDTSKPASYKYVFARVGTSWAVILNNPSYGKTTDTYYVSENYFIIASSASDLNKQNQARFNTNLPGTVEGNAEYNRLFASFVNAYNDWDNKVK